MIWWSPSGTPSVLPSDSSSGYPSVRPFSALFSFMLWHIQLKFCTWLCLYVQKCTTDQVRVFSLCVNFYTRVFRRDVLCMVMSVRQSRFSVRVSLRHSFSHFSPTCFDVLSWHFVSHFRFMNIRSSLSIVNVRQLSYAPLEIRILQMHSFPHFSPTCFDILSWNIAHGTWWKNSFKLA